MNVLQLKTRATLKIWDKLCVLMHAVLLEIKTLIGLVIELVSKNPDYNALYF